MSPEPTPELGTWIARHRQLVIPTLLACLLILIYLPSLSNEFLNYDDPWLIQHNPVLKTADLGAVQAIWLDLSQRTRLTLGAEYLPLRDLSLWLEARMVGLHALPLRLTNLALYIASCLTLRSALLKISPIWFAELCALLFAVHPVHVESVAWLAGRKDMLALLFSAGALHSYISDRKPVWTALWVLAAMLSKSASVILPLLLPVFDLLARRKPRPQALFLSLAVALASMALHLYVGRQVGMIQEPLGGSRWTALITMGTVWPRYLWGFVNPSSLSVVQPVVVQASWSLASALGYLALLGGFALGLWLWLRKQRPWVLVAALFFLLPLLPVSQVFAPLQNTMADRYALLAVLSYGVLGGALGNWLIERSVGVAAILTKGALALSVVFYASSTLRYSAVFASSERLFRHAVQQAPGSAIAHYQLGKALLEAGDDTAASAHFERAIACEPKDGSAQRRATNNLARLQVQQGRLADAELLLVRGRTLWPSDAKVLGNLIKVWYRQGRIDEARALYPELKQLKQRAPLELFEDSEL